MRTEAAMAPERPIYIIRVRAEPQINVVRALRAFLKVALRRFGLRALSVDIERDLDFNLYRELEAEEEARQERLKHTHHNRKGT
jgi:hypothetical protein